MARKYEIGIAADTGLFEKAIKNGLVDPLEDAEDAFDDLEKAAKSADLDKELKKAENAADDLDEELDQTRDSLKRLKFAADDVGDSTKAGFGKASENVEEFKSEAAQNFSEVTSSFDGSMDSILDMAQGTLGGLASGIAGPLGLALGLAAAGIGAVVNGFVEADEKAEDLRLKAVEFATAAQDAGASTDEWISGAAQIVDRIRELEELKSTDWRWFWMDDPTQLEEWSGALRTLDRDASEVAKVLKSESVDAINEYRDAIDDARKASQDEYDAIMSTASASDEASMRKAEAAREQILASDDILKYLDQEITLRDEAKEAHDRQADAGIDNALAMVEAEEARADAMEAVKGSITNAYDSMRDAAVDYATDEDGALDINRWLEYNQEHAAAVATYQANIESIKLSPEQWSNLLEMPEEQRMQWVSQFAALPETARSPFAAALNDVGSSGGSEASVAFDQAFEPDADVTVQVETAAAEADLTALSSKKRTAEIKTKVTGGAKTRTDLDALARTRTATITARVNTGRAERDMAAWRRDQESRPITITANVKSGKRQLS